MSKDIDLIRLDNGKIVIRKIGPHLIRLVRVWYSDRDDEVLGFISGDSMTIGVNY